MQYRYRQSYIVSTILFNYHLTEQCNKKRLTVRYQYLPKSVDIHCNAFTGKCLLGQKKCFLIYMYTYPGSVLRSRSFLTGSGSRYRYFFFTGSGSFSYKNRLKVVKKCFCLHILTPTPALQHCIPVCYELLWPEST